MWGWEGGEGWEDGEGFDGGFFGVDGDDGEGVGEVPFENAVAEFGGVRGCAYDGVSGGGEEGVDEGPGHGGVSDGLWMWDEKEGMGESECETNCMS